MSAFLEALLRGKRAKLQVILATLRIEDSSQLLRGSSIPVFAGTCAAAEFYRSQNSRRIIMTFNPARHHRKSIRLRGYDYSRQGYYFITICIHDRWQRIFGKVMDGTMDQNEFGEIVHEEWNKTAVIRPYVVLDEFSVMPNHLHGIIHLTDRRSTASTKTIEQFGKPTAGTIPTIVRALKSAISKRIHEINPEYQWQRNYYEHIVRDEKSLFYIRKYIRENPLNWDLDNENHIDREIDEFEMAEIEIDS